jgi:hypothetical protein
VRRFSRECVTLLNGCVAQGEHQLPAIGAGGGHVGRNRARLPHLWFWLRLKNKECPVRVDPARGHQERTQEPRLHESRWIFTLQSHSRLGG